MVTTTQPVPMPVADWISPEHLYADPFPLYERMRAEAPVAFVPATGHCVISRFDDCRKVELDQQNFTAVEAIPMMDRAVGVSMLRRDDPDHGAPRKAVNRAVRIKQVQDMWRPVFAENTRRWLDHLEARGPGADLNADFAAPLAATNLQALVGLSNVGWDDVARWSSSFIAATANIANDPDIWAANDLVHREVEAAVDEMVSVLRAAPDASILSAFIQAGLPDDVLRSNIKLCIAGGINEPQHSITSVAWALANNPEQAALAATDPLMWYPRAFTELARWISPIGGISRAATRDVVIGDVLIEAGTLVLVSIHSANRDEYRFESPEVFDITTATDNHYAFGGGTHMCAGRWAAECAVGEVALPMLYERFPDLEVVDAESTSPAGWIFRGLDDLRVTWTRSNRESIVTKARAQRSTLRVINRRDIAEDMIELELGAADGTALEAWDPGAHLTLTLPVGDRHYSIIGAGSHAGVPTYRVIVQLERDGRGGSQYLHAHGRPGADLVSGGVRNNFTVRSADYFRFVAGGVGITPLLPMMDSVDRSGASWSLDYLGRSPRRMPYLAELAGQYGDRIRVHITGETGRPQLGDLLGDITSGDVVYACGPAGMLDEIQNLAQNWPSDVLQIERFAAVRLADDDSLREFTVTLARTGTTHTVGASDTIVEVLERAGVEPATSCLEGVCGTCETRVLDGTPCHRDSILNPAEHAHVDDRLMICVSRSYTPNLVLDL